MYFSSHLVIVPCIIIKSSQEMGSLCWFCESPPSFYLPFILSLAMKTHKSILGSSFVFNLSHIKMMYFLWTTSDIPVSVHHCLLCTLNIHKLLQTLFNLLLLLLILATEKLKAIMLPCHLGFFPWTLLGCQTKTGCKISTSFPANEGLWYTFHVTRFFQKLYNTCRLEVQFDP